MITLFTAVDHYLPAEALHPVLLVAPPVFHPDRRVVATDDSDFRIRPGRIRDRGVEGRTPKLPRPVRARAKTFMGEVHQAMRRAGGNPSRLSTAGKGSGRCNARGRGAQAAAGLKGRSAWSRDARGLRTRMRRVAVKARIVKLNPQRGGARTRAHVSAKAVDAHLRYLERDGVTRDGEKGQVYSADKDVLDGRAFLERGREDRHQFRFIVSAEEGVELADLRQTTRDLMGRMEVDLGTKLDWIAVDHHNTGHPHTHILLRGVTDDGRRLDIAGDYIAHGIRERASEVITLELGRQTEQEVTRQLEREVDAERFTRLDRMLLAQQAADNPFADLRPDKDMALELRQSRALLIERARKLEGLGLATERTPGIWTIKPDAEEKLRALGERGDIIKTMHRAVERDGLADTRPVGEYALHRDKPNARIVGQVLDKQLAGDELGDRIALTIDGADGRVHYVEAASDRVEDVRRGSIVAVEPPPSSPRQADHNILAATDREGAYSPSAHREQALARIGPAEADAYVRSHVRRLEALRRAGIVERLHSEHWIVPADLPERGLAYDRKQFGSGARVNELSHLPLDKQVSHEGATWLDKTMTGQERQALGQGGFGDDVRTGWDRRRLALAGMGYATDLGDGRFRAQPDMLAKLERAEVSRVGKALAAERGLEWKEAKAGDHVGGELVGQTRLASGRFAMLDSGLGFQLVPWSDPLEKQLGRTIGGVAMPGGEVHWDFGRNRGLGL